MATIKSDKWAEGGGTVAKATWEFTWSESVQSPGVTKVSWTLKATGLEKSEDKWAATWIKVTATPKAGAGSLKKTATGSAETELVLYHIVDDDYEELLSFNDNKVAMGTFYVAHANNGSGQFTITLEGRIYQPTVHKEPHLCTLTTNVPYSACRAPTSITCNETIQARGGKVTLTVSGGTAGVGSGHTVSGYAVQYKIGSGSWTDATITNSQWQIPGAAAHGATISFRAKTLSNKGSNYNSTFSDALAKCTVNTPPKSPVITLGATTLYVPCDGSATIKVRTDGDAQNQSLDLKYSINTTSLESLTDYSELGVTANTNGTYRFYAHDGLEYSNPTTVKVVVNPSKPTISSVALSGTALTPPSLSGEPYVISPTVTVTRGDNGQTGTANTYSYTLIFYDESKGRTGSYVLGTQQSSTLTIPDVRLYKSPSFSEGYYYRVSVVRNDGIENSDPKVSTNYYYVTALPSCSLRTDNTSNPNGSYFAKSVSLQQTAANGGYTGWELLVYKGATTTTLLKTLTLQKTNLTADLSDLTEGSSYTFKMRPVSSLFSPNNYYLSGGTKTRTKAPKIVNLKPTLEGDINPFIHTPAITFDNFFPSGSMSSTYCEQYGLSQKTTVTMRASYLSNTAEQEREVIWTNIANGNITDTTISINLLLTDMTNLFDGLGINKNSSKASTVTFSLSFNDQYGQTFSGSCNLAICYVTGDSTNPVIGTFAYQIKTNGENMAKFLARGCKIYINNLRLNTVYRDLVEAEVKIVDSTKEIDAEDYILSITQGVTVIAGSGTTSLTLAGIPVPSISDDHANIKLGVRVKDSADQWSRWSTITPSPAFPARGLWFPASKLTNLEWDDHGNLKTTAEITDLGFHYQNGNRDKRFSAQLWWYKNSSGEWLEYSNDNWNGLFFNNSTPTSETPSKTMQFSALPGWEELDSVLLAVEVTAKLYPGGYYQGSTDYVSRTKRSSDFRIYKASPTLAYRKNQIGVNHTFSGEKPLADGAFVVKARGDDRKKVYFVSAEREIYIDLVEGTVDSLIIDGGTWDQI